MFALFSSPGKVWYQLLSLQSLHRSVLVISAFRPPISGIERIYTSYRSRGRYLFLKIEPQKLCYLPKNGPYGLVARLSSVMRYSFVVHHCMARPRADRTTANEVSPLIFNEKRICSVSFVGRSGLNRLRAPIDV